jgi:uncharacterized protein (TIGR02246 family)
MKTFITSLLVFFFSSVCLFGQDLIVTEEQEKAIRSLIGHYTQARDLQDQALLESILTENIDQLVSSGVWRKGKEESMKGMMRSSQNNSGKRTITVESIRLLTEECAIADARYEIQNDDGTARKMWSTFVVVMEQEGWKISAIRNMLPSGQR